MTVRRVLIGMLLATIVRPLQGEKRAFTIEDFYRVKGVSQLAVSPDRKSILYSLTDSDLSRGKRVTQVWIMDADGRNARQLTAGDKGADSPAFHPTAGGSPS